MALKTASIAMNDRSSELYISTASAVKTWDLNMKKQSRILCKSDYADLTLSRDGEYLVAYSESKKLDIMKTSCELEILLSKRWTKKVGMARCCFSISNSLLVPVQNELFKIDLGFDTIQTMSYKCMPNGVCVDSNEWSETGHILGIAVSRTVVFVLYYSFKPAETRLLLLDGEKLVLKSSMIVPREYNSIAYSEEKGLCLFSSTDRTEVVVLNLQTMQLVTTGKKLPSVMNPQTSYTGRYLTFQCYSKDQPNHCAYLLRMCDLEIVDKRDGTPVYHPGFSLNDKYWLLPGEKTQMVQLDDLGSVKAV